jgi:hypothetical protein
MVAQKGKPTFGWLGISGSSAHPAGDSSFADIKAEHEKLTMDARSAPRRVLGNHPEDPISHFCRDSFSPEHSACLGYCTPIESKSRSVPPDDSFGTHEDEGLFPAGPESPRDYPEEPIGHSESGPEMPALQNGELLPKDQVFEQQRTTRLKDSKNSPRDEPNNLYHASARISDSL